MFSLGLVLAVPGATASAKLVGAGAGLPVCGGNGRTGGRVHGWRMGAVQFSSPSAGVGVTAGALICTRHSSGGTEVSFRPEPVQVAVSSDGGLWWQLTGNAAPVGPGQVTPSGEQLVAASPRRLWVIAGEGRLLATTDGGRTWERPDLPIPTVQLTRSGAYAWALTCAPAATRTPPQACRPALWRAPLVTGAWAAVALPKLTAQASAYVHLAVSSGRSILLSALTAGHTAGELAISTDAGGRWRLRREPRWEGRPCGFGGNMAAAPPRTFWLLCIGGAAAGSSTKGLLRSTDSGSTWSTVSAVTSLTVEPSPTSLPLAEPDAIAAGSAERIWLSTTNGLAQSGDGGRTWNGVRTVLNPGGWPTTIFALDATHAWLLAPGAGIWSTGDGTHWRAKGPLHTS